MYFFTSVRLSEDEKGVGLELGVGREKRLGHMSAYKYGGHFWVTIVRPVVQPSSPLSSLHLQELVEVLGHLVLVRVRVRVRVGVGVSGRHLTCRNW